MRILLFGCRGQVGWELQRALAPLGELVALDRDHGPAAADFARPDEVARTLRELRPAVVVNAAGYTAVDRAESETALAAVVNAETPARLAAEAAALGATLVHYGTDYVFDGSGDAPRDEDAPAAPLNAYGRTKLDGERRIRASGCRHLILRTSWVHAPRGENFVHKIVQRARQHERIEVVDDQIGAPTAAELVADVTAHALRLLAQRPELAGTYHLAAAGTTSWHGVAGFVVDWARERGLPLRLAADGLCAVPSSRFETAARRPLNSRLDTTRLRQAFGLALPDWRFGVRRTLEEAYAGGTR